MQTNNSVKLSALFQGKWLKLKKIQQLTTMFHELGIRENLLAKLETIFILLLLIAFLNDRIIF